MKHWMKAEIMPLAVVLGWLGWIFLGVDLIGWQIGAAFTIFCLLPVGAGIFYGHAVGRDALTDNVVADALEQLEQLDLELARQRGSIDNTGGGVMARENCDRCKTPIRSVDVIHAEVGIFDSHDGGPEKLKIDLVVACPDCGLNFYTFVDVDDLIPGGE